MPALPAALRDLGFAALIRRIAVLIGSRMGGSILTLLYTLILARIATPEDFGLAMLGLSWALLASIPLSLNIEGGSIKYLVGYVKSGETEKTAGFLRFNLSVLMGLGTLGLAGLAAAWALGWIDPGAKTGRVALLAALTAPVLAITRVYGRHATALDAVLRGSLPRMLVRPLLFCLVLGALWLMGHRVAADQVMGLFLMATILTALLQAWLLRHTFADLRSPRRDLSDHRSWIQTGLMLAPLLLMRENLKNIIIAAAGLVLGAAEVGLLALALSLLAIVIFAVKAVDIAISPRLSKAIQTDRLDEARLYLAGSAAVKLAGTGLGLGAVALLGNPILGAFGPDYLAAKPAVLILFAIPVANAVFGPTDMVLNIAGQRRSILTVSIWSFALLVAGTALGGTIGGLTGAAWGAALPYALQQTALCRQALKHTNIDPSLLNLKNLRRNP